MLKQNLMLLTRHFLSSALFVGSLSWAIPAGAEASKAPQQKVAAQSKGSTQKHKKRIAATVAGQDILEEDILSALSRGGPKILELRQKSPEQFKAYYLLVVMQLVLQKIATNAAEENKERILKLPMVQKAMETLLIQAFMSEIQNVSPEALKKAYEKSPSMPYFVLDFIPVNSNGQGASVIRRLLQSGTKTFEEVRDQQFETLKAENATGQSLPPKSATLLAKMLPADIRKKVLATTDGTVVSEPLQLLGDGRWFVVRVASRGERASLSIASDYIKQDLRKTALLEWQEKAYKAQKVVVYDPESQTVLKNPYKTLENYQKNIQSMLASGA